MSLFDFFRSRTTKLGLKAFTFTPLNAAVDRGGLLPRTNFDYAAAVSNGLNSNVVMAPVQWLMRTFPEAELVVEAKKDGRWRPIEHPLDSLLMEPNPFYGWTELLQSTVLSWFMDGNAYWIITRSALLAPVELWYVPHWLIEPKWSMDGTTFITHYEYRPDGRLVELPVNDVVHLRFGLDPKNPRIGLSPVKALMREVFTDDEAANFSATILKNMGIPGVVVSPKDAGTASNPDDVKEMKEYFQSAFSGDNRGAPLIVGAPTEVKQFGFDPNQLMLGNIRDIVEERVCAAIGIPAAVVGFGSGLQSTKVGATMRELRRLAWIQCVIPTQRSMAQQLGRQLLPQTDTLTEPRRLRFDTSNTSSFQEEETQKADRIAKLVTAGILRVDRAQELVGLEVDEAQAVYLRPSNAVAVSPDGALTVPPGGEELTDVAAEMRMRGMVMIDGKWMDVRTADDITGNGNQGD